MSKAPSYYRARIAAIQAAIAYELTLPESREREMRIAYLRNGHVPDKFLEHSDGYRFGGFDNAMVLFNEKYINLIESSQSDQPLTEDEIAQYDTWFAMHPEKVCGQQVGGSGYSFPVKTLGSRQDIERAIDTTLSNHATRHSTPGAEVASGKRQVSSDKQEPDTPYTHFENGNKTDIQRIDGDTTIILGSIEGDLSTEYGRLQADKVYLKDLVSRIENNESYDQSEIDYFSSEKSQLYNEYGYPITLKMALEAAPQKPDTKPGLYYVDAVLGNKTWLMLGPFYNNHQKALDLVDEVRKFATKRDGKGHFVAWGTLRMDVTKDVVPGNLNKYFPEAMGSEIVAPDGWENHLIKARKYAYFLGLDDPIIKTGDLDGIVALINNHLHSTPAPSSVKRQVSIDDLELAKAIAIAAKAELELLELELELA